MEILRQYPFIVPLVVGVMCECVKILKEGIQTGNWSDGFFRPGGMPSTHSAFVTSLLIVIWHLRGLESVEFAIATVFACIVWYDATHSRREVGELAKAVNVLQKKKRFAERVGHSVKEVIGGIVFGTVMTWAGIWLG